VKWRDESGDRLPMVCWRPGPGYRMISSGVLGGGIGAREWVLNAQVPGQYARTDPAEHLRELAGELGLTGPGVGMLTAAQVTDLVSRSDQGVEAAATAGLRVPTWAAATDGARDPELAPGTINIIVSVPVALSDAALVNAVITATEAKTQAVLEAGFRGTGTATDAVCVAAPVGTDGLAEDGLAEDGLAEDGVAEDGVAEDFAGPRSLWGARIARAVHAAVLAGATAYAAKLLPRVSIGVRTVPPSVPVRTATPCGVLLNLLLATLAGHGVTRRLAPYCSQIFSGRMQP
jgi:adenosylcobinamide amidohydrolase